MAMAQVALAQQLLKVLRSKGKPEDLSHEPDRLEKQLLVQHKVAQQISLLRDVNKELLTQRLYESMQHFAQQRAYYSAFRHLTASMEPIASSQIPLAAITSITHPGVDAAPDAVPAHSNELGQQGRIILDHGLRSALQGLQTMFDRRFIQEQAVKGQPGTLTEVLAFLSSYARSYDFMMSELTTETERFALQVTEAIELIAASICEYARFLRQVQGQIEEGLSLCAGVLRPTSIKNSSETSDREDLRHRADNIHLAISDSFRLLDPIDDKLPPKLAMMKELVDTARSDLKGIKAACRLDPPPSLTVAFALLIGGSNATGNSATSAVLPLHVVVSICNWCHIDQARRQDNHSQLSRTIVLSFTVAQCLESLGKAITCLIEYNDIQKALFQHKNLSQSDWESWENICLDLYQQVVIDLHTLTAWGLDAC